jgi:hypothetical protein
MITNSTPSVVMEGLTHFPTFPQSDLKSGDQKAENFETKFDHIKNVTALQMFVLHSWHHKRSRFKEFLI